MRNKKWNVIALLCVMLFSVSIWGINAKAATQKIVAKISASQVEVGKVIKITSTTKSVTYSSSDTSVAYVNKEGVIVGKKKGTITISVKKPNYTTSKFNLKVIATGNKPTIDVWYEELSLVNEKVVDGVYTADVKNNSKQLLNKVEYVFNAVVEEQLRVIPTPSLGINDTATKYSTYTTNLTATASNINGKGVKTIKLLAPKAGKIKSVKLVSLRVYTKEALIIYNPSTGKYTYQWGTKDTKAPVISGLVGSDSYIDKTVYITLYPDKKFDFNKYITVKDNRDNKVTLNIDTSKVNYKKVGTYEVTFTATDKAGNKAKAVSKVQVRLPKKIDKMADELLSELVTKSMTDQQKSQAIYKYLRKNYTYVGRYDEDNWEKAAEYGMKYESGDCITYYAVARILFTRLGMPNMMIARLRKSKDEQHHWWNLVYVKGGWYHYDACPRSIMATFCLVTSEQLSEYSKKAGNSHNWDVKKYPKTATVKISKVVWHKRY